MVPQSKGGVMGKRKSMRGVAKVLAAARSVAEQRYCDCNDCSVCELRRVILEMDGLVEWKAGDKLTLRAHKSGPCQGITYDGGVVTAVDPGTSGGWDVYYGERDGGRGQTAFYGFSVEAVSR